MIQQEGPGWRFARDPSRADYQCLIGGETWAFELTDPEWRDLVGLLSALEDQHRSLADQLMEEESIDLEMERGVWWASLDGDRNHWQLSLVLSGSQGRGVEGHWPSPAAMAIVAAMRSAMDSQD